MKTFFCKLIIDGETVKSFYKLGDDANSVEAECMKLEHGVWIVIETMDICA